MTKPQTVRRLGTHWAWTMNFLTLHQIPGSLLPGKLFNEMFRLHGLRWDGTSSDRFIIPHNEGLNLNTLLFWVHLRSYSPAAWPTKAEWIWVAFLRIANTSRGPPRPCSRWGIGIRETKPTSPVPLVLALRSKSGESCWARWSNRSQNFNHRIMPAVLMNQPLQINKLRSFRDPQYWFSRSRHQALE